MIKHTLFILLTCTLAMNSGAQLNLVRNGSFEKDSACPNIVHEVYFAIPWTSVDTSWNLRDTSGSIFCPPTYINGCSNSITGSNCTEPVNPYFHHYPRTGIGMMDVAIYIQPYSYFDNVQREYLQERLSIPLTAGQSYCVTFYMVNTNWSQYAVNHIGAYFDDGSIDTVNNCSQPLTQFTPQILDTTIINDSVNWVKIQGSFIANGTEKFITIGDFFDSSHTRFISVTGYSSSSDYLLDDVSVIASDSVAHAGANKSIAPGDSTWIGIDSNGDGMPCYWYVLGNPHAIDSGGYIKVKPDTTTTYVVSMDLCGTVTRDTVTVWVWPLGTSPSPLQRGNISVYPIPAQDVVYIKGLYTPATYKLCNMIGSTILQGTLTNNSIDVSKLASGGYVLVLTPQHTPDPSQEGNVVVRRIIKQ